VNLTKWIGIPSAAAAIIGIATWIVVTAWPAVGWESPSGHNTDVLELRKGITNAAQAASGMEQLLSQQIEGAADALQKQIKEGQDEYRCDKIDVDLRELRRELRANPGDPDLVQDILRLEERRGVNGLNCARFEV